MRKECLFVCAACILRPMSIHQRSKLSSVPEFGAGTGQPACDGKCARALVVAFFSEQFHHIHWAGNLFRGWLGWRKNVRMKY